MGKLSRDKGARWEREVAAMLREIYPDAKRGAQSRDGSDAPDVDIPGWWIECKVGARTNPRAALRQAEEASDGRTPVAACKDDRQRPFVCMYLDDWMHIVEYIAMTLEVE